MLADAQSVPYLISLIARFKAFEVSMNRYKEKYNGWRRFFMAVSAGHELAFYPANQLEEVPRRVSRLLYLLEDDMGGEEITALQNRLHSLLGLNEGYSNSPTVQPLAAGEGNGEVVDLIHMSNDTYSGLPVAV